MRNQTIRGILLMSCGFAAGIFFESQILSRLAPQQVAVSLPSGPNVKSPASKFKSPAAIEIPASTPPATVAADTRPKLVVAQPIYDFGSAERGTKVPHTFVLGNEGSAPVEIKRIKTSTGNMFATLKAKKIEPGENTEITVSLNLRLQEGKQDHSILVQSNDPQYPAMRLKIVGMATSRVQIEPRSLRLGKISQTDGPISAEVTLTTTDNLELIPIKTITSSDAITADFEVRGDNKFKLNVVLDPKSLQPGRFSGWAQIQSAGNREYVLLGVPISGIVQDDSSPPASSTETETESP